jgi:hypothetical protein
MAAEVFDRKLSRPMHDSCGGGAADFNEKRLLADGDRLSTAASFWSTTAQMESPTSE